MCYAEFFYVYVDCRRHDGSLHVEPLKGRGPIVLCSNDCANDDFEHSKYKAERGVCRWCEHPEYYLNFTESKWLVTKSHLARSWYEAGHGQQGQLQEPPRTRRSSSRASGGSYGSDIDPLFGGTISPLHPQSGSSQGAGATPSPLDRTAGSGSRRESLTSRSSSGSRQSSAGGMLREGSLGPHEIGTLQEQMRGLTTTTGIGGSRRQSQSSSARSSKSPAPIVTEGHQSNNQSEEEAEPARNTSWTDREKALVKQGKNQHTTWTDSENALLKREIEKGHSYQKIADEHYSRATVGEKGTVRTQRALTIQGGKLNLQVFRPKPPVEAERVLNESEQAFLDSVDLINFPRCHFCLTSTRNCDGRGPGGIPRCKNCQGRSLVCNDPTREDIIKQLELAATLLHASVDWAHGKPPARKPYTDEDDKKLLKLVTNPRGVKWEKLAEDSFPGRTGASLSGHYRNLTKKREARQAHSQQDMGASMHSHGHAELSSSQMHSMHQGTSELDAHMRRSTQQSFLDPPRLGPDSPNYIPPQAERRGSSAESERQQSPQQQTSLPQISSHPATPQAQSAHQGLPSQRSSPARQSSTAQASSSSRRKRTQQERRGSNSEAEPSQASKSSRKKKK